MFFEPFVSVEGMDMTVAGIWLALYAIYGIVVLIFGVGSYVLQSLGVYAIAKRREIRKPWLAWLPVGDAWIMGSISDQYQYVVKGKVKNKRKALLCLSIFMWVALIAFIVLWVLLIVHGLSVMDFWDVPLPSALVARLVGLSVGTAVMALLYMGFGIAVAVIRYIALYDLYRSCEPQNGLLYLLLSVFVSFLTPLFLFLCRNKDLGMPPRRPEPEWIPTEPWEITEE